MIATGTDATEGQPQITEEDGEDIALALARRRRPWQIGRIHDSCVWPNERR